jgi:hypothetical protein
MKETEKMMVIITPQKDREDIIIPLDKLEKVETTNNPDYLYVYYDGMTIVAKGIQVINVAK